MIFQFLFFSDLHCTFSTSSPIPVLERYTVSICCKITHKVVARCPREQWDLTGIGNRKSFSFLARGSFLETVHRNSRVQGSD